MSHPKFTVFKAWEKPVGIWDPAFDPKRTLTEESFQTVVLDRSYIMSVESAFCSNTHIPYCVVITKEGGRYDVKETVENFCLKHLDLYLSE